MFLGKSPNSFFCTWISCFANAIYWKGSPFFVERYWYPCQKSFDFICKSLFPGSLFCSFGLYVCAYASTTLVSLLTVALKLSFEIRKRESSRFVLFQDSFGHEGSFEIPVKFLMGFFFLFLPKSSLGFFFF